MTTRIWKGKAKNITQVKPVTIAGTWATSDTITVTVDGIDFVVTIGSLVTTSQVATTLLQAFNGSTLTDTTASCSPTIAQSGAQAIPQLKEIEATIVAASPAVVVLTARTSGKPFTITVTEVTAGDGTATLGSGTAATGQNFVDNADNWSGDTLPVDGDDIVFNSGNVSCKYGTLAIQPGSVTRTKQYTGQLGLFEINTDNAQLPYNEYRTPKALTFDDNSTTCTYNIESGSNLTRIDAGAGQAIFNITGSAGSQVVTGQPNTLLTGTHASNVLNCQQGDVGVAYFAGETATLVAIRCGNGTTSGATVVCGAGVTLTSCVIDVCGGNLTVNSATASADVDISANGTFTAIGTGAHANIDVQSGTCNYKSNGTLTTLAVRSSGVFDKSVDPRAMTVTNAIEVYKGATFKDPTKSITASGGYTLKGCIPADITWNVGTDRTYAVT